MITTIFKTLTVLLLLIVSSISCALAEGREVVLVKTPVPYIEEDPIEIRMPSRPIQCIISEDGICIQGYDADDILSYEAYDMDGVCLIATLDVLEFISYVLTYTNELEIRFLTGEFMLKGYVSL